MAGLSHRSPPMTSRPLGRVSRCKIVAFGPAPASNNLMRFTKGDLDGFFGLFVDNLIQLMVIAALCPVICGIPATVVASTILPGAAVSLLLGNLFYAWQAQRLARETGRQDITALPYGINTPSVFAFIFLIMGPVYSETQNAQLAWQAGLFACFLSGLMECAGAFCGDWIRRHTPRAALLSALAGIALTFISMGFIFQMFANPAIALIPMLLILLNYASHRPLPFGLPAGLVAILLGVVLGWGSRWCGFSYFIPSTEPLDFAFHFPTFVPGDVFALFFSDQGWKYLAVIFPMGLFNVIGSLQNLESAEAAGDRFPTRPSLLANGLGTIAAAFFGSAFPTTIYIGHPGWKALGARAGYSSLNGIVITLVCFFGAVEWLRHFIPMEATLGILLWIGLIITAQAFQEVPKAHALAVVLGLIPALAAWALVLIETSVRLAGAGQVTLLSLQDKFAPEIFLHGVFALSQGSLLTSMILAAILAHLIDRQFRPAAAWCSVAALFSAVGLIHAYDLTRYGLQNKFGCWAAPEFAVGYAVTALLLLAWPHLARTAD
jgi:AGZA family xanthine/uracil permease-like MFS transporter